MTNGYSIRSYILKTATCYLFLLLLGGCSYGLTAKQPPVEIKPVEVKQVVSVDPNSLSSVYTKIYQGKFEEAQELLKSFGNTDDTKVAELRKIVQEYQTISDSRKAEKEKVYSKKLEELKKLEKKINEPNALVVKAIIKDPNGVKDINDVNDVNDVNDISKSFSAIANVAEYANQAQRKELMEMPFVKNTIEKAKVKAVEFEAKGKWLDSYLVYYSWMDALNKDSKEYKDYADSLLDKANIVGSFQDSPCETSTQRYKGVKKELLIKSVKILNAGYVSVLDLDYREMAKKGIERCSMLAEVVVGSYDEINKTSAAKDLGGNALSKPDSNSVSAWHTSLNGLVKELDEVPTAINLDKFIDTFEKVLKLNQATVKLPEQLVIAHFTEAALAALDRHTIVVWPQQEEEFQQMMTNEFSGIGVEIMKQKGELTIGSLLLDTPAYTSGLDAGDIIEKVNGLPTKDMTMTCAIKNIKGPAGTKVTLTMRREGKGSWDVVITRGRITVPSVRGWQRTDGGKWDHLIDQENKIGYVRLTAFDERSARDFDNVLKEMGSLGIKGLILDLRMDPGGLLTAAIDIVDKFIDEGLIVRTQPRYGMPTYAMARKKATYLKYPLIIMIDGDSASASEIVAGALADPLHRRAILVGERSFGKGSVQTIYDLGDGAELKFTMAYYHLPSGQKVKSQEAAKKMGTTDWGVAPDVEVKKLGNDILGVDEEFKKMLDVRKDNETLYSAGRDPNQPDTKKKHTVKETIESDPQLAVGLLEVRTKLIEQSGN